MSVLMTPPFLQFIDSNGDVLASGKVNAYEVGGVVRKNTFTDQAAGTPNANPVILDSAGRAQIWLDGSYRFIITDSADVTIKDIDNVTAFSTGLTSGVSDITTDFTEVVVALGDSFLFADATDNNATKRDTMAGIDDLFFGGLKLLQVQTASSDASIDFTSGLDSTYEAYVLEINDLIPATGGAVAHFRLGNGGSFDSGSSDYSWGSLSMLDSGTTVTGANDAADSEIDLTSATTGTGSSAGEALNSTIVIYNPAGTRNTVVKYTTAFLNTGPVLTLASGSGQRIEAAAHDRAQIIMSTGSIASGQFRLYGVKKA